MFSTYLRIAFRGLRRQPFFSAINVGGLAIGLAVCWLIGLYVIQENSYDHFLPHADRVCAVALDLKMGQEEAVTTNTPPPIGPRLAADFPEVELVARTFNLGTTVVQRKQPGQATLAFNENAVWAVDTAFLELFGFPMVAGDVHTALDEAGSLVLSQRAAQKYFGEQSAIGQSLLINDQRFTITGVVQNLPTTSSVQFEMLAPTANFGVVDHFSWSWIWLQMDTWVRLRQRPDAASLAKLEAKFPAMVSRYAPAAYERIGQRFEDNLRKGDRYAVKLLPLNSLHLNQPGLVTRLSTLGDASQVRIFGVVGLLILLLACVNFMNLNTARSMQRAREVGVRKALGSGRLLLIKQFMVETLPMSGLALLLAAALASAAMPMFNQLTGYELTVGALFASGLPVGVLVLLVVTTMLGGLYPAFYLSRFKAADILKASAGAPKGSQSGIRSGLVVFQFAVSIILMISSLVMYQQLDFAQKQSPGLQREHVLVIENAQHLGSPSGKEAFRQQLLELPEIQEATHSTFLPSLGSFGDFYEPEQGEQDQAVTQQLPLSSYLTDASFVPTLGIEMIAGRNFRPQSGADSASVILNEAAVKAIGWENPIGQWIRYPGNENQRFQVVGVMRNFHLASVRMAIEPVALFHESSQTYQTWGSYLALRLKAGTEKAAIDKVASLWKASVPEAPFEYDFLDAAFATLYRTESKTSTILGIFTGLALFIGCLGLFALAAFMTERRTKEIGVRKVLGASVASITGLLAKDFLQLVLIAFVIASPLGYYFMQRWLASFVYHIEIHWLVFVGVGLASLGIAFLTVSAQSVRAALANPIKSLRSE